MQGRATPARPGQEHPVAEGAQGIRGHARDHEEVVPEVEGLQGIGYLLFEI